MWQNMKTIEMHLLPKPFEQIKNGKKQIEIRLYDEKRQQIRMGDIIVFSKLPDKTEQLTATVTGLSHFPTFRMLLKAFPAEQFGFENASMEEMLEEIYEIYPCERERQWGVLGIHLKYE